MSPSMISWMARNPGHTITSRGVVLDGRWPVTAGRIDPPPYTGKQAAEAAKLNRAMWARLNGMALSTSAKTEGAFVAQATTAGL